MRAEGIICLANETVSSTELTALCNSVRIHDPGRHLTVIPYDSRMDETRKVLDHFGFDLFADETVRRMEALGRRYWPAAGSRAHNMKKLCAFWGPYERFLLVDADMVLLRSAEPYFEAFRDSGADFMYFRPDIENVYRPGPVREMMIERYDTAAFNGGTYLGRRGALTPDRVEELERESRPLRDGFVDNLEQSFINFCVDAGGLHKVDGQTVPYVVAGALMNVEREDDEYVLRDHRVPEEEGRPLGMMHWAGYATGPYMPYRRMFLDYRLPDASRRDKARVQAVEMGRTARAASPRHMASTVKHRWPFITRNWLAARGVKRASRTRPRPVGGAAPDHR